MKATRIHTTIGLKKSTKARLNKRKAPGQCYDGFLCQLMDMWEEANMGPVVFRQKQEILDKGGSELIIHQPGILT
jgi:hypothetical protein